MKFLKNKMSLRLRIFISMILLVFTATLLVLGSTYYQYRTESDQYNSYRQDRKENQLKRQINYIVCLLYTSPSPRDVEESRMPSSA